MRGLMLHGSGLLVLALVVIAGGATGCGEQQVPLDRAGPFYNVEIDEENSVLAVEESETVVVRVNVKNIGNDTYDPRVIFFEVGDVKEDQSDEMELEADETTQVTFEWQTEAGDAGWHSIEVGTQYGEDGDSTTIQVEEK